MLQLPEGVVPIALSAAAASTRSSVLTPALISTAVAGRTSAATPTSGGVHVAAHALPYSYPLNPRTAGRCNVSPHDNMLTAGSLP